MENETLDFQNDKVSTLFRRLLIPTLCGTVAISAMTALDGIIVGQGVGAEGLAAVNIIVPLYQIISGITLMVGVGCSVEASLLLSQQKKKKAQLIISQALLGTFWAIAFLCALAHTFIDDVCIWLGASETLLPMAKEYLTWMLPGFMFENLGMIGLFIVRLDGAPKLAMWVNIAGAAINGVLDWLFVFPLQMGLMGAGLATSISLFVCGSTIYFYLRFKAKDLRLVNIGTTPKMIWSTIKNIGKVSKVGLSSLLGEVTLSIMIFMGNNVFMRILGDEGVGAFGIACYYAPFIFLIGNSLAQAVQPIISYNFGAGRWSKVQEAFRLMLITGVGFGLFFTFLFVVTPHWLIGVFLDVDCRAGEIALSGFPYFATGIVFFILNVAIVGYYQSMERLRHATFLIFLRCFAFSVPTYILLPQVLGVPGAWLTMSLSEGLTFLVAVWLLTKKRATSTTVLPMTPHIIPKETLGFQLQLPDFQMPLNYTHSENPKSDMKLLS